jgi:uncharacterized protein (DUF1778 family)
LRFCKNQKRNQKRDRIKSGESKAGQYPIFVRAMDASTQGTSWSHPERHHDGNLPYNNGRGPFMRIERLEARITNEQKQLILRAAALEGRSITDFVVASAQAAARRVIEDHEVIRLSAADREAFVSALLSPPAPHAKLRAAARRYRKARA